MASFIYYINWNMLISHKMATTTTTNYHSSNLHEFPSSSCAIVAVPRLQRNEGIPKSQPQTPNKHFPQHAAPCLNLPPTDHEFGSHPPQPPAAADEVKHSHAVHRRMLRVLGVLFANKRSRCHACSARSCTPVTVTGGLHGISTPRPCSSNLSPAITLPPCTCDGFLNLLK